MQSRAAVLRRDQLIERLAAMPAVQGALDQLVQHFGHEAVAEVTGRSRRIVRKPGLDGEERLCVETRPGSASLSESPASELSRALASNVEAVCRHYLSNGRRRAAYWTVGDVLNTPGRSLYVRLTGPTSGKGAAGNWTDAATGQHGDLLDLIGLNCGLSTLRDAMDEARLFLALPSPEPPGNVARQLAPRASPEAARRLLANRME